MKVKLLSVQRKRPFILVWLIFIYMTKCQLVSDFVFALIFQLNFE